MFLRCGAKVDGIFPISGALIFLSKRLDHSLNSAITLKIMFLTDDY